MKALPILFLLPVACLHSQNPVADPPRSSQWTVTIVTPAATRPEPLVQSGTPESPTQILVRNDEAANAFLTITTGDGQAMDGYIMGDRYAIRPTQSANKAIVAPVTTGEEALEEIFTKAFHASQWIRDDLKTGTETVGDMQCDVYARPELPLPEFQGAAPPPNFSRFRHMPLKAWINTATRHPVRIELGEKVYTFSPAQPWNGTVTLPGVYKEAADDFQRQFDILEAFRRKSNKGQP